MNQTEKKRLQKTLLRAIETLDDMLLLLNDAATRTLNNQIDENERAAMEQMALELQADLSALGHDLGAFTGDDD